MTRQPNTPQTASAQRDGQRQAGGQTDPSRQPQQFETREGGKFAAQLRERMDVVGADGQRIGAIDRIEGDRIKLARNDWQGSDADRHHFLPLDQIQSLDGNTVRLAIDADRARSLATTS